MRKKTAVTGQVNGPYVWTLYFGHKIQTDYNYMILEWGGHLLSECLMPYDTAILKLIVYIVIIMV